jgi:protein O-mannosyl-transferase
MSAPTFKKMRQDLVTLVKRVDPRRYQTEIAAGFALVLLTLLAMGGACSNGFVNYDDNIYVTGNLAVLAGLDFGSIEWAFTATRSSHWHPLTWLSLMLDADVFGPGPWGFHFTSLVLHIVNVLLLFAVLRQMTGAVWRSALAAGLFAVHPLHVESVAWISDRKDVLAGCFWLLTTIAYVHYARRPGVKRYAWVAGCFSLGLLAKSMLVTLPCTLLLLDYWPLRRISARPPAPDEKEPHRFAPASILRLVGEKVPLFALSALCAAFTLHARQKEGAIKSGIFLSLGERLGYAVNAYVGYLGKTLWPADLAPYYPLTPDSLSTSTVAGSAALLILLTAGALVGARWRPYLAVGWLWYLGTLFPVSGVVQLASYVMADRYTYVPLIGLFILFAWGIADLVPQALRRPVLAPAAIGLLLAAAVVSRQQVDTWHDGIRLWEHALTATPDNFLARASLGSAFQEAGQRDRAKAQMEAAERLARRATEYDALGNLLLMDGATSEAIGKFRKAVELEPREPRFRQHLAGALEKDGQKEEAQKVREEARGLR